MRWRARPRLKGAIAKLGEAYDYVLLDCPPALNLVTVNALTAAHSVMISHAM